MKIMLALAVLSLLVSCNDKDIDGVLKVFKSFVLTEEDGGQITIPKGEHEADFSYKSREDAIELEIDSLFGGGDRDFMFSRPDPDDGAIVSYDTETRTERLRLNLPSSVTGQPVHAEVVISNRIIVRKKPQIFWDRCGAYHGTRGGLLGLLGFNKRHGRDGRQAGRGTGDLASHIYTVSSPTESRVSVAINIVHGEETVALFEGTERRRYRELYWKGECGDYSRPILRKDD